MPVGCALPIRHVWLTDQILEVHAASHGTYGARRVHAELTLGRGLVVGHGTVELLMARASIRGVTGRPRWRRPTPDLISADLVERNFARSGPNQLWVTDIGRHEAPWIRVEVRDLHRRVVAAARSELRAV